MIIEIRGQLLKVEFAYWDRSVRASITDAQDGVELAGSIATASKSDQINWRIGRKKALAKTLKQLDWTYEERTDFWAQLFDPEYGIRFQ